MDGTMTTLERAFELARTGKYSGIQELRQVLKNEGYAQGQIDGPALGRQLREIMRKSKLAART
jgi:hypothetical protein